MLAPAASERARFTQLTNDERLLIRRMLTQGRRVREIAANLGKHRSSIFREIRRNINGDGVYDPIHAAAFLRKRRLKARAKLRIIENDPQLQMEIEELLSRTLSPEQIVGYMQRAKHLRRVCTKTIYEWIDRDRRTRKVLLRHRGRPRFAYGERKGAWESGKRHISERPKGIEKRRRVGDGRAISSMDRRTIPVTRS